MTIKLDALSDWKLVPGGQQLLLPSDNEGHRRVRIDLNCEEQTRLYVDHVGNPDKEAQFVAVAGPGLETVEFFVQGDISVGFETSGGAQIWIYTAELEPNVSEVPDAVSFTEIHQRRARNPELELMQFYARQNERRMDERLARMEELAAQKGVPANVDSGQTAPVAAGNGAKPVGGDGQVSGEVPPVQGEPASPAGGSGDES